MPPTTIDLSIHLNALCKDLILRVPEFGHIDPCRVLFTLARSRSTGTHGVYARICPLRLPGGTNETSRRRGQYLETLRLPPLTYQGNDILYLITIMIPRFLRLTFEQRLQTVIHELYHISEAFDGDIRRFAGRNFAHGSSRQKYNLKMAELARNYLKQEPAPGLLSFLQLSETDWDQGGFHISGLKVPVPKLKLIARKKL